MAAMGEWMERHEKRVSVVTNAIAFTLGVADGVEFEMDPEGGPPKAKLSANELARYWLAAERVILHLHAFDADQGPSFRLDHDPERRP